MSTSSPSGETAADSLHQFIYGHVPLEYCSPQGPDVGEPWTSFQRARELFQVGQRDDAIGIWQQIAAGDGLESRQALQAWHFLRQAGHAPPPEQARHVLGVVAEVPVDSGHDVLSAYEDGSARYLNHAGSVVVWEDRSFTEAEDSIRRWLATGNYIVQATGPWDEAALPVVPEGHMRVAVLTPGGPHFGQGPQAALLNEKIVGTFFSAATDLLQTVVGASLT